MGYILARLEEGRILHKLSLTATLRFSFSFLFGNFGVIAARIALPALAAWLVLYGAAHLYLSELLSFLGLPSDRSGSIILGLLAASLLGLLLLHAMIAMAIAALAALAPESGWPYFRAGRREWRLYAACLRILLVLVVFVSALVFANMMIVPFAGGQTLFLLINFIIVIYPLVMLIRGGFLAAPVVVTEGPGPIVRRSLHLSWGNSGKITLLFVILVLPGVIFEVCTEALLRSLHVFPMLPQQATISDVVRTYNDILPGILVLLMLAYLLDVVLLTLASVSVYRQLTAVDED